MKIASNREPSSALSRGRRKLTERRGVVVVLTGFCLAALFAFVALSVDSGRMVLTETEMQNAVDAAALAAAQEITSAVHDAGQQGVSADLDANSIAVAEAREMAALVADANGIFVDPNIDVKFGKRTYNTGSGTWPIEWGATPYNVVQVVARKTNADVSADDGQLPLAFGWAIGRSKVPLTTTATAFVEARDLVIALDFSGSMNYDSNLVESDLSLSAVEGLLDGMWTAMRNGDPKWPNSTVSKFPSTGFGLINSAAGTYVSSTDTATILNTLQLNQNTSGSRTYPYPQAGRTTDGLPKGKPNNSTSDSLWTRYIDFVKNHPNTTYRKKYGYRTLMDFMQQKATNGYTPRSRYSSEDMWRTPHQPMNAVKNGASLFLNFVKNLEFGDEVGLVGYGEWAEQIISFNDGAVSINLAGDPITPEYDLIDNLQLHHQAGEFNGQTMIGDGILKAREMLVGNGTTPGYTRYGARPTILLMTDGNTTVNPPSGWSFPSGFSWAQWTDFDGNGTADYSTTDTKKRYDIYQAVEAAKRGITIHTLAVGASADTALMQAIAHIGNGLYVNVPGGSSVAQMEDELLEAFGQIASKVPPPKLVFDDGE